MGRTIQNWRQKLLWLRYCTGVDVKGAKVRVRDVYATLKGNGERYRWYDLAEFEDLKKQKRVKPRDVARLLYKPLSSKSAATWEDLENTCERARGRCSKCTGDGEDSCHRSHRAFHKLFFKREVSLEVGTQAVPEEETQPECETKTCSEGTCKSTRGTGAASKTEAFSASAVRTRLNEINRSS